MNDPAKPPKQVVAKQPVISTIGYEEGTVDELIETLQRYKVKVVIDVRNKAVAKKPSFSKAPLSDTLAARRIGYVHLQGLGNPKTGREMSKQGSASWKNYYKKHLGTKQAQEDLKRLLAIATEHHVALLCFERDAKECHRHLLVEEITAMTGQTVEHLTVPKSG